MHTTHFPGTKPFSLRWSKGSDFFFLKGKSWLTTLLTSPGTLSRKTDESVWRSTASGEGPLLTIVIAHWENDLSPSSFLFCPFTCICGEDSTLRGHFLLRAALVFSFGDENLDPSWEIHFCVWQAPDSSLLVTGGWDLKRVRFWNSKHCHACYRWRVTLRLCFP